MDLSKLTNEQLEELMGVNGDVTKLSDSTLAALSGEAEETQPQPEAPQGPRGSLLMGTAPTPTPTADESGRGLLSLLDLPGSAGRTVYHAAKAGISDDPNQTVKDSLSQSLGAFQETGHTPSTGSLLGDIATDPLSVASIPGLVRGGARLGGRIANSMTRQGLRPAQAKLMKEGVGDLGKFLQDKGFKGGSAKSAEKFAKEVAENAINQRTAIVEGAQGAGIKAQVGKLDGARKIAKKALSESTNRADKKHVKSMLKEIRGVERGQKSASQIESLRRGVDRRISDASRVPTTTTTIDTQFNKALRRDLDSKVLSRISPTDPAAANVYKQLGQEVRMGIKAQKPLRALAEKPMASAVDWMLLGAGGAGAWYLDNPTALAALALKRGMTSPTLMTAGARLAAPIATAATPVIGQGIYQSLQSQRRKPQND
jgi:hypothetical protein